MDGFYYFIILFVAFFIILFVSVIYYEYGIRTFEDRCNDVTDVFDNGSLLITYRSSCAEYYSNELNYTLKDYDKPSFGLGSYTLERK